MTDTRFQIVVSLVRPAGFEPATLGSEDRCAIQLRHGRVTDGFYRHASKVQAEFRRFVKI